MLVNISATRMCHTAPCKRCFWKKTRVWKKGQRRFSCPTQYPRGYQKAPQTYHDLLTLRLLLQCSHRIMVPLSLSLSSMFAKNRWSFRRVFSIGFLNLEKLLIEAGMRIAFRDHCYWDEEHISSFLGKVSKIFVFFWSFKYLKYSFVTALCKMKLVSIRNIGIEGILWSSSSSSFIIFDHLYCL